MSTLPVLHQCCTGITQVLRWHYTASIRAQVLYTMVQHYGTALRYCTDASLRLCLRYADTTLVLSALLLH